MNLDQTLERMNREQLAYQRKLQTAIAKVLTDARRETGWSKARIRQLAEAEIAAWRQGA